MCPGGQCEWDKKGESSIALPLNVSIYVHLNVRLVYRWAAAVELPL